MTQKRLNGIEICHVHKDRLDAVKDVDIAKQFANKNDKRIRVFGKW